MTINFKIKRTWIITLCMLFYSLISFGQDYSDEQIGLDIVKETISLKERGITNNDDINIEIDRLREVFRYEYVAMKKSDDEILQKINSKRLLKTTETFMDVSMTEKEALKALYDSTNGENWKNNSGWDFSIPVTSWDNATKTGWYGIIVSNGQVVSLDLNTNNLNGFIPSEIGQLKYLLILNLATNNFSGSSIPEEIGNLNSLQKLALNVNNLSGSLPQSFYNLKNLIYVWLDRNELTGTLSPDINKLTGITEFYLRKNKFSGQIPSQIGQLLKAAWVSLAENLFTGSIPPEIGQMNNLSNLYLDNNKLTGTIPPEIGSLKKAKIISLHYNNLKGSIPVEVEKLSLEQLYLNNNLLEGLVPNLTVKYILDIRYNKLFFLDFSKQFTSYKTKGGFYFYPQVATDIPNTITSIIDGKAILKMGENDRFTLDDTFQWYKNNLLIPEATSRVYTIVNLKATDAGIYSCKASHTNNPDMSPLVLEREPITLNIVNCTAITGTIKVVY